jgi:hypothetical protein
MRGRDPLMAGNHSGGLEIDRCRRIVAGLNDEPIARRPAQYTTKIQWQLFHTDVACAEANHLATQKPERLEKMKKLWPEEAQKYDVLPISDHASANLPKGMLFRVPVASSGQYTYYPGTAEVPEASAAPTCNSSFKILAEIDFTDRVRG